MGDYTHSQMRSEIEALEQNLGLTPQQPQTLRNEVRGLINAEPGSDADRARKRLGKRLILFGIFGFPFVLLALMLIGWMVWSIVGGIISLL